MWETLRQDGVGKVQYEVSLKTASYANQRVLNEAKIAKAIKKKRLSDACKIEALVYKTNVEKTEADAALERVTKNGAEFERAMARVEVEKGEMEKAIADAEKDGVIDDAEEMELNRMRFDVKVAQARLEKELLEFEVWEAKAMLEIEQYAEIKKRLASRSEFHKCHAPFFEGFFFNFQSSTLFVHLAWRS